MADDSIHPFQPKREQPELRLEPTLEQVCNETPLSEADASELMRIEEALSYANEVLKQTIPPRPRLDADDDTPPPS